jgi:hypothetical protein
MRRLVSASLFAATAAMTAVPFVATPALAKLPALSDEAKAKAADTAAKTAWTTKVGNYQLCRSIERTAEHYRKTAASEGRTVPPAMETPACVDAGPYVPPGAVAAVPPLEAAGAHSPPATATAPPSSKATAAEIQGKAKK